jgi:energy-coupling factor transporter transmembrane protein EcfT
MPRRSPFALSADSVLRRVDARTKLALGLAASAAVMLPLAPLAVFTAAFAVLIECAGLRRPALAQLRRVALLLALLFALDWAVVGPAFALLISLRVALLVSAFTVLVSTTTADELRAALERLGLPARLAFALASAYRAVAELEHDWRGIVEAQRARGLPVGPSAGDWRQRLRAAVALVVPAIVLATQRAWLLTEAAAVRGLDSPRRHPHGLRPLARLDQALLAATAVLLFGLAAWR